jgi:hypothetical protein
VVVLIVLIFLVEGELGNCVRLPRLVVLVAGGAVACRVLLGEEAIPELLVLVLAVLPQHLGEVANAAVYFRIQPQPHWWRRRNRHPGTVDVPAVGEGDVGVVDALVCRPERIALLERHVAPIALPRWGRIDGRPSPHIILRPGHQRQLAQKRL